MKGREIEKCMLQSSAAILISAGLDVSESTTTEICPYCELRKPDIRKRRMNTAYAKEDRNWVEACGDCFQVIVEEFKEMWADYYADCL